MGFTGPLPEKFRRRMQKEDRTTPETRTNDDAREKNEAKSEKALQALIMSYLRGKEIEPGCQRMDRKSNMALGWPDIVFAFHGVPVALEVKVGANKQTPEQVALQSRLEADGWLYFVVRSLDDVIKALGVAALVRAGRGIA